MKNKTAPDKFVIQVMDEPSGEGFQARIEGYDGWSAGRTPGQAVYDLIQSKADILRITLNYDGCGKNLKRLGLEKP